MAETTQTAADGNQNALGITNDTLRNIVDHIFLPTKLPQALDPLQQQHDASLSKLVGSASKKFLDALNRSRHKPNQKAMKGWERISTMLGRMQTKTHKQHQLDKHEVESELLKLKPAEAVAFQIAAQNAGVIFRSVTDHVMTFEAFELSLPAKLVNGTEGKIIQHYPSNPRLPFEANQSVISALANVLAYLSTAVMEDASYGHDTCSPRYVTEALAGIIRACPPQHLPRITTTYVFKRINDQALLKSASAPWRRSSRWLLLRVYLQTTLQEKGVEEAHGYKPFIAYIMAMILSEACKLKDEFSLDLLFEMNAKLARRLAKIGDSLEDGDILPLKYAVDTVNHVGDTLRARWIEIQDLSSNTVQWDPPLEISQTGFNVTFPSSQKFLISIILRSQSLQKVTSTYDAVATAEKLISSCGVRAPLSDNLPTSISKKEVDISLYDFETWVQERLPIWSKFRSRPESDCLSLYSITEEYRALATSQYKGDPQRLSLMHLCILELWVALDRIVVRWCPLLSEYSPEIPEDIVDPLLLPTLEQMERVNRVQMYLRGRHKVNREHGKHSVFDDVNHLTSFANRFLDLPLARSLHELEERIQQWTRTQKESKIKEFGPKNQLARQLEAQMLATGHNNWNRLNLNESSHVAEKCERCLIARRLKSLTISPFEEPLPEEVHRARPILFELETPPRFALWRDATLQILLSGHEKDPRPKNQAHHLEDYVPLSGFYKSPYPDSGRLVVLASATRPICLSPHMRELSLPLHNQNEMFLAHAGDFRLFDPTGQHWLTQVPEPNLRPVCTFRMSGAYESLEKYTKDTKEAPNTIIASLQECPSGLSPTEYVAFGHIRAGKRIQWRNIMRALRAQSLTFSDPSVVSLVLQSIWQAESMGEEGVYREAHFDLQDHQFGMDVIEELQATIKTLGGNWKRYLHLYVITVIACRLQVCSPHEDVQIEASGILIDTRKLAQAWLVTMQTPDPEHSRQTRDSATLLRLRHSVVGVAFVLRASFDTSSNSINSVEDAALFIYAGTLTASNAGSLPNSLLHLSQRNHRLALRLEANLAEWCIREPAILDKALSEAWKGFTRGAEWRPLVAPATRWWTTTTSTNNIGYTARFVHLNLLDGTILVDGTVSDRLPVGYTTHPTYVALLGSHIFLDVRPSTMPGMSYQTDHMESELHFGLYGEELLIRRRCGQQVEEYIPTSMLANDLPDSLVKGHQLWYIESRHVVEIRPATQTWMSGVPRHWIMRLVWPNGHVRAKVQKTTSSGSRLLLDPHSGLYKLLGQTLESLDPNPRGLLVTKASEDESSLLLVYLPRHDLSFQLDAKHHLKCQSVPGYTVGKTRKGLGSLIGLKSFLCLQSTSDGDNGLKVIVPKGAFILEEGHYGHPTLSIDIGDRKGYFLYEVDDLVGRLVGNRTMESDLYLAKLHGFTSSSLPDPLTQRTGTSESLDRLSSASCLSELTISVESRKYLDDLAKLSPVRAFHSHHPAAIANVSWHQFVPPTAQHREFQIKVQGIINHWRETVVFHQQTKLVKELDEPKGMMALVSREAYRAWPRPLCNDKSRQGQDVILPQRDAITTADSQEREHVAFCSALLTKQTPVRLPTCRELSAVVKQWSSVRGVDTWKWKDIREWLRAPRRPHLAQLWCTLYELCRKCTWPPPFEVTVAIGFLGYSGIATEILASLMGVIHNVIFKDPKFACPRFPVFNLTQGWQFRRQTIYDLVKECKIGFKGSDYEPKQKGGLAYETILENAKHSYKVDLERDIMETVNNLEKRWPQLPNEISAAVSRLLDFTSFSATQAQQLIQTWSQNRAFIDHIRHLEPVLSSIFTAAPKYAFYKPPHPIAEPKPSVLGDGTLDALFLERIPPSNAISPLYTPHSPPTSSDLKTTTSSLDSLLVQLEQQSHNAFEKRYLAELEISVEAFRSNDAASNLAAESMDEEDLTILSVRARKQSMKYFKDLKAILQPRTIATRLLGAAEIWPALSPRILLGFLSLKGRRRVPDAWIPHLVQYAVTVHDARRFDRMLRLQMEGKKTQLAMELRYIRVWDPITHPEWLLVEIDSNVSIRVAQALLATEMLAAETSENSVMQLNMGEGKSSVIVPIVAAVQGAEGKVLSRIIVPRAQTKQQLQFLRRALTSLADRPIIHMSFHRQLVMSADSARGIHKLLRKFTAVGGIWLCEPEQLLSLRLLGLDKLIRSPNDVSSGGKELTILQSWLNDHTRDILDECDEVLHPRQQVIYTVGHQQDLDSGKHRWQVVQKLLSLLSDYISSAKARGTNLSGFLVEDQQKAAALPQIRIQSDDCRQDLQRMIRKSFEDNEWSLPRTLGSFPVEFIISPDPSDQVMHDVEVYRMGDTVTWQKMLILRGFIAFDILLHGLKEKRWRVQYGLDLKRSRLAIPYRAKDVPSVRSEFGHPDVTILLTCLSYYYGGLDDEMLQQSIKLLLKSPTPDLTYTEWLKPCWNQVPEELRTIKGIDVDDKHLLQHRLGPFLKYNKVVIDFYLDQSVFPAEAKEFRHKLCSSGWDTAAKKRHVTTGFSGTTDGKFLFPTSINQVDRVSQLHTNARVLSHLLLQENKKVVQYSNGAGSSGILDVVCSLPSSPTVILDVGAQILDCSNLDFAKSWLSRYEEDSFACAVVYFDGEDNLMVLSRDGSTLPLLGSPYADNLERCLVYLDDAHTRGTDLRLPKSQAAVTLGPKVTKDKLVQGCMRMRQLGYGQTLVFLASEEVVGLMGDTIGSSPENICSSDIIIWTIKETWKQLQNNVPTWMQQGYSFVRRDGAWKRLSRNEIPKDENIRDYFCEVEARTLEELYDPKGQSNDKWLRGVNLASSTATLIAKRCQEFDSFSMRDSAIHEEMEIELIHEKEVEREVQRLFSAKPLKHFVHPHVSKFVSTGQKPSKSPAFLAVKKGLANTSLKIPKGTTTVFNELFLTDDFSRTVDQDSLPHGAMDHFLRPVEWLVTALDHDGVTIGVALSPYEVDQLLPSLRTSKAVKLHLFSPRTSLSMRSFEDLDRFVVPSTSTPNPVDRELAIQINLFSGALYLRDYAMFKDLCGILRLYFGEVPAEMANGNVISPNGFVKGKEAQEQLGFADDGFDEDPVSFLDKLLTLRRYGLGFGPSHMGKLLSGTGLQQGEGKDFPDDDNRMDTD